MISTLESCIRYAWKEFKKAPAMFALFLSILCNISLGYITFKTVIGNNAKNTVLESKIIQKDSIILQLTNNYARADAIREFQKDINDQLKKAQK